MHTLHYMLTEAENTDEAFRRVQDILLSDESPADWSDWHVVGGGRWSGSQYEDSQDLIISYKDNKEKFLECLELIKQWRIKEMTWYSENIVLDKLYSEIDEFMATGVPPTPYDMNKYYLRSALSLLSNRYSSDSSYFDLIEYTPNMDYVYEAVSEDKADYLYLVPVDFHF